MVRVIITAVIIFICGIASMFFLGMALIVKAMEYMYTRKRGGE